MTKILIDRAVVEQALEAIQSDSNLFSAWTGKMIAARTALRAALAQQDEPRNQCGETCERAKLCAVCASKLAEPVPQGGWHNAAQWLRDKYQDHPTIAGLCDAMVAASPPAPPQRMPLTEEEILEAVGWERAEMYMKLTPNFPVDEARKETIKNARAVERAVWEKNHG